MNLLKGIINYKVAISLLRNHFAKELQTEVTDFKVSYNPEKQNVYFTIKGKKYLFDNDLLKTALISNTKGLLNKTDKLVFLELEISAENIVQANIYIIDEFGNQKCLTKNL